MVSYDGTYVFNQPDEYFRTMFIVDKKIAFTEYSVFDDDDEKDVDPKACGWVKVAPKELTGW